MSSYRVLNTRPAHQAASLTRLIENKGGFVFNLPVFEIQAVPFDADNADEFDYLIFLSTNAVIHYFQKCTRQGARIIAIGTATKLALEKQGVRDVICPSQFNSDGILSLPEMQSVKNKKIVIICGENSKSILLNALRKRGAKAKSIICYRRHSIAYDMHIIFQKIIDSHIDYIISTSLESYFALLTLFENPDRRAWLLKKTICVISDEMKQQAINDGFLDVIQAKNAIDEAIVLSLGF